MNTRVSKNNPGTERKEVALSDLTVETGVRPTAPPIGGATAEHRQRGRQLAMIHRMHLAELDGIRRILDRIERGEGDPVQLGEALSTLDMTRNYRNFGTLCGRECQHLFFHHTAEDTHLFPLLELKGSEGLRAVVARLKQEHLVVHALIERLEANATAILERPGPETFKAARETFLQLEKTVRSHFGYEETQLEEALGFLGII